MKIIFYDLMINDAIAIYNTNLIVLVLMSKLRLFRFLNGSLEHIVSMLCPSPKLLLYSLNWGYVKTLESENFDSTSGFY